MMLIYDGDCSFCAKCAKFGKARLAKPLEIVPWQSLGDLSQYGLTLEDVSQRVYFIEANKVPIGGPRAIFRAGECMKKPWPYLAKEPRQDARGYTSVCD